MSVAQTTDDDDIGTALSKPFQQTLRDTRGGFTFDYITGEQAISRLNDALGVDGWSFKVLEHGIHEQADEVWVLAEIMAGFPSDRPARLDGAREAPIQGTTIVVRQQFGSQKIKRSRQTNMPLDIGFDLKGATTDALKKCATLLGVGLYLTAKTESEHPRDDAPAPQRAPYTSMTSAAPGAPVRSASSPSAPDGPAPIHCKTANCTNVLTATTLPDGRTLTASQLANEGLTIYRRALCAQHFIQLTFPTASSAS